jgi:hypothetical protein
MNSHIFKWIRYLLLRLLVTAVLMLLLLACFYVTSFVFSFIWTACTQKADRPAWFLVVCLPAGALLFIGIARIFRLIDWALRIARKPNDEKLDV